MIQETKTIPMIRTILYPTDLGSHMRPAFRFAVSLARQYKAMIVVMHVLEPLNSASRNVIETYLSKKEASKIREEGLKKVEKKMRKRLSQFCEDEMGVSAEKSELISKVVVVMGTPAESIIQEAEERGADLIVMGTHTDLSLGHRLIGSTARKLTHISKIPVLVVPVYEE
ncbi:MAG: universal stress protein [Sulfitobacter sp.]|nr:universal stress protein [Sulfitobacter sp.]